MDWLWNIITLWFVYKVVTKLKEEAAFILKCVLQWLVWNYFVDKVVSKLEVEAALVKLMNPAYRSTIETILTSTDVIDNIIAKSKALQKDLVAQSKLY